MDVFENLLYLGLWLFFGIIILAIILRALSGSRKDVTGLRRRTSYGTGSQWDTDLRLPYKRFKELYPWTKITYQEYKKLQMERAFRRAVSSEKNKRMVR
jgi:hypothetical protein